MKNYVLMFVVLTIVLILSILVFFIVKNQMDKPEIKNLQIGDKHYQVEIVRSEKDQIKGLSDRNSLEDIDGMLFVYDDSRIRSFWMEGMRFDLDIIWIRNSKIIGFTENISYQDQGKSYKLPEKCDMVLELKSGRVKNDDLKIGNKVEIK